MRIDLPPVTRDYLRFAADHRAMLANGGLDEAIAAGVEELRGAYPLALPTDRPRRRFKGTSGGMISMPLPAADDGRLDRCAAELGATRFQLYLAAFATAMREASGVDDLVFGVGHHGRPDEHADTVGPFACVLPVRLRARADMTFAELVGTARIALLDADERMFVPFSRLVRQLLSTRDAGRDPLVQIVINTPPLAIDPHLLTGLTLTRIQVPRTRARFDYLVSIEHGPHTAAVVEYDATLFDRQTAEYLSIRLREILDHAIEHPDARLDTAPRIAPRVVPAAVTGAATAEASPAGVAAPLGATADEPGIAAVTCVVVARARRVLRNDNVSPHDNIFAAGGGSLEAATLVQGLAEEYGLEVPLRALFETATFAEFATVVTGLHPELAEALAIAEELTDDELAELTAVDVTDGDLHAYPVAVDDSLTQSEMQFWLADQLLPGSPLPVTTVSFDVCGDLDLDALRDALTDLAVAHEALRTRYVLDPAGFVPRRDVQPDATLPLRVVDATDRAEVASVTAACAAGFTLAEAPLARFMLIRSGAREYRLVLSYHHIVGDFRTLDRCLLGGLSEAYRRRRSGEPPLPAPGSRFAELAAAQRQWRSGDGARAEATYWQRRLAGMASLVLPTDRPRPPRPTFDADIRYHLLPAGHHEALAQFALSRRLTTFMLYAAAVAEALRAWSGAGDVQVLTPTENRPDIASADVAGCFINMMALRFPPAPADRTWDEVLYQTFDAVTGGFANQRLPLSDALSTAGASALFDDGRNPYVSLTVLDRPLTLNLDRCSVTPGWFVAHELVSCDLEVSLTRPPAGFVLEARYRRDLFEPDTIEAFLNVVAANLDAMVNAPEAPVIGT